MSLVSNPRTASNFYALGAISMPSWRGALPTVLSYSLLTASSSLGMTGQGVGASVLRKEDDRFLRGRGQYVADFRLPGAREVAFVRSSVAHGRIRNVHVPDAHQEAIFTARHLSNVNHTRAAPALSGFKHSSEPILARDKVRYVGELVAICVAPSRAQAEDIADSVTVDYEELEPVVDMLAARRGDAPLVHEEWGDNVFIEFFQDGAIDRVAETAAITVMREIRTARNFSV